ncbi:MAG TPA: hypothetical protein VKF81_01755 [Blastocatellia bacterium]|nr:hypothetical protein [Blastocatellia bacterium]
MFHIHNGESTANTLREFGFQGEHIAFQEVLMAGPTPGGLSSDEWLDLRARFLSDEYELKIEDCISDLLKQEAALLRFFEHDETILWFEHDLFCQVNLIYLLDWFSKQSLEKTRLSLICVGEFPGVKDFRGLGQLTGGQLASLFDGRHEVTAQELSLASRAWAAYCSADPEAIERLIREDTSALPFLASALQLYLARFPSVRNGLGRIENKLLELISDGATSFNSLFVRFVAAEPVYGLGDLQLRCELKRLAKGREPLINVTGVDRGTRFHEASLELTDTGRAVLAGKRDFIEVNGIDLWLGGAHVQDQRALWRWDAQNATLARRAS